MMLVVQDKTDPNDERERSYAGLQPSYLNPYYIKYVLPSFTARHDCNSHVGFKT